jgi:glyoxylase-like metal-dependent hydrolase (beta-lactamase superfamily II)
MMLHIFPFGPLETNTILFGCPKTKKAAVIDPALGSTATVLKTCSEHGFEIDKILLTHSHWDHIADVHALLAKVKKDVYVHPLDAKNVEQPGSDGIPLFQPIQGVKPNVFVQEGDRILVGEIECQVIHTPGHSPGSVCYFLPAENTLFSGDTLFQGSIGKLTLPTGEPALMWESLRKLTLLPDTTRVFPGHGQDTTLAKEKQWLIRAKSIFS